MGQSGILMHITSLPGPQGIGTLGREAKTFVDFLAASGQRFWQMLPLGPAGPGNSPYSAPSLFAGNPLLLDLDALQEEGLLLRRESIRLTEGQNPNRVDFARVKAERGPLLARAARRGLSQSPAALADFRRYRQAQKDWLEDYALFAAMTNTLTDPQAASLTFARWPGELRAREPEAVARYTARLEREIDSICYLQYLFDRQLDDLKQYADARGVAFIGDLPIYAAAYSADVWASPSLFDVDGSLTPRTVAGCPPDYFSPQGQRWDNPPYRWESHRADGYRWWKRRVTRQARWFHTLRLDHFRAFDSYYAIPVNAPDALEGTWRPGPGIPLIWTLKEIRPAPHFIAEDLGTQMDSAQALRAASGFPGMRVLQFAFDPGADSIHLPHHHTADTVVYTGTHDNDTVRGWLTGAPPAQVSFCRDYLGVRCCDSWSVIAAAWRSTAHLAIAPMQDFLNLGSTARMNTPGTAEGNWAWRVSAADITAHLAQRINRLTGMYGRSARPDTGEETI